MVMRFCVLGFGLGSESWVMANEGGRGEGSGMSEELEWRQRIWNGIVVVVGLVREGWMVDDG